MSYALTKLLPLFVYPLGLAIMLCLFALVFGWARQRKVALVLVLTGIFVLWVASTQGVANFVLGSLESDYPPRAVETLPAADAIVVLGGIGHDVSGTGVLELSGAVDRLIHASRIYRAGKAKTIIVSGGSMSGSEPEAALLASLLVEWGVDESSLLLETRSRNTYENAMYTQRLLQELGMSRILLVTSAFHMARAEAVFTKLGIDVIPAATDYQVSSRTEGAFLDWLPDAGALASSTFGLKEYLGRLVYRWRGWL